MKKCFLPALLLSIFLNAQTTADLNQSRIMLPNGWSLTPVGKQVQLGDLPLNMAVSRDKKLVAITNNGQSKQNLQLLDVASGTIISDIPIDKSWYGLSFSEDGQFLYASGGHDNVVHRYTTAGGLKIKDQFRLGDKWPNKIAPAGLAVSDRLNRLFVVTNYDNALYVFDAKSTAQLSRIQLDAEAYACILSPDLRKIYVSVWGGKKVLVFDTKTLAKLHEIQVGSHPNEMVLDKKGKYLFVANSEDNSVSVIETSSGNVIQTLNAATHPDAPTGSTSNGVALSEDGKRLYIANADNNCLAVYNVQNPRESMPEGFIPVGWYPTNVKVIGKNIYVANGKGLTSLPNPKGPNPTVKKAKADRHKGEQEEKEQYIGGLFKGTLSIIPEPDEKQLDVYTAAVYQNSPYGQSRKLDSGWTPDNPIPLKVGDPSPIKYVFYIIKENRTYDQVLGDIKKGNGDPSLTLFGEKITPNQHALANGFVLLDNFYVNAEVSADGHNWSLGGYANDYVEKTWPTSYGGRGGDYPAEGEKQIGNNKNGFLWDYAKRAGVTFRTYGEFADQKEAKLPVLEGHFADYPGYDLSIQDIVRFEYWKKDFDALLAAGRLPGLSTIRFGNDHTEGLRAGKKTPYAHVADNDLAVGKFIDYLSHSPIWKESAVFILEDDAQNGPDHIDAHRSTAYVISPYVKRGAVDHTMYSTASMLRTMELILGIPPMSQYDAGATPMYNSFTGTPDFTPYSFIPANVDLEARNPANTPAAKLSEHYNWKKEDAVPDLVFNDILWIGLRGTKAPAPVRSAFLKVEAEKDED